MDEKQELKLSEEDINKIIDRMGDKLIERIYTNVGEGILSFVFKGIIIVIIGVAAYGAAGSFHFFK